MSSSVHLGANTASSSSFCSGDRPFPYLGILKRVAFIAYAVFVGGGQQAKAEKVYHQGMPFDGEKGFDGQNADDTWEAYVTSVFRDVPRWTAHEFNYERMPGGPDGIYMGEIPKAHRSKTPWPVYDITEAGTYDYEEADCTIRLPYTSTSLKEDPNLELLSAEEVHEPIKLTKPLYVRCGRITIYNNLYSTSNVTLISTGLGRSLCNDDPRCDVPLRMFEDGVLSLYIHKNQISRSGDLLVTDAIMVSAENLFVSIVGAVRLQEGSSLVGKNIIFLKTGEGIEQDTGAYLQELQKEGQVFWDIKHSLMEVNQGFDDAINGASRTESLFYLGKSIHYKPFDYENQEAYRQLLRRPFEAFEADVGPKQMTERDGILHISKSGVYNYDGPCIIEEPIPLPRRQTVKKQPNKWFELPRTGRVNILAVHGLHVSCHSIHVRTHIYASWKLFLEAKDGDVKVDPGKRILSHYVFIIASRSFQMPDRSLLRGHGAIAISVQGEVSLDEGTYQAGEGVSKEELEKEFNLDLEIINHPKEAHNRHSGFKKEYCKALQEKDLAGINKISTLLRMFFVSDHMADDELFNYSECLSSPLVMTMTPANDERLIPSVTGRLQVRVSKDSASVVIEKVSAPLINREKKVSILVISEGRQRYVGSDIFSLGHALFLSRSADVQFPDAVHGYYTKKRTLLRGTVKNYHERRRPTNLRNQALDIITPDGSVQFESSRIHVVAEVNIEAQTVKGRGGKEISISSRSSLFGKQSSYSERLLPFTITADELNIITKSLHIANFMFTLNRLAVAAEKMSLDREIEQHRYKKSGWGASISVGVLPVSVSLDSSDKRVHVGLPLTSAGRAVTTKGNDVAGTLFSSHALAHEANQIYQQMLAMSLFSASVGVHYQVQKKSFQTLGPGFLHAAEITLNVASLRIGGGVEIVADRVRGNVRHLKEEAIHLEQKTSQTRFGVSMGIGPTPSVGLSFSHSVGQERERIPPQIKVKHFDWQVDDYEQAPAYEKEVLSKGVSISQSDQGRMIGFTSLKNGRGKNYLIAATQLAEDLTSQFRANHEEVEVRDTYVIEKKPLSEAPEEVEPPTEAGIQSQSAISAGVEACYDNNMQLIKSLPEMSYSLLKEIFAPDYPTRTKQLSGFVKNTVPKIYATATSKIFWENAAQRLSDMSARVTSLSKSEFEWHIVYWSSRLGCEVASGTAAVKGARWISKADQLLTMISRTQLVRKPPQELMGKFVHDKSRAYIQMHPAHTGVKWLSQQEIGSSLSQTAYAHTTTVQNALSIIKDKTIYPSQAKLGWGVWISTRFEPNFGEVAFVFDRTAVEGIRPSASQANALGTHHFWTALPTPLPIASATGVVVLNRAAQPAQRQIVEAADKAGVALIDSNTFFKAEKIREQKIGIVVPRAWKEHKGAPVYKVPKVGLNGKEGAKDIPHWAKGSKPFSYESGKEFAKRLMNDKYGAGNYPTGPKSEYNQIKKWGDRSWE
ncbi:MAG: hypothetical protein K9M07_07790 [Simkaniaceae bacterium]|nr:hypothetical protein [Simkaniaceae bacterium]